MLFNPIKDKNQQNKYFNSLPYNSDFYRPCEISFLKTSWEKEKNAGNLHFLLSPYCFRHFQIQISIFSWEKEKNAGNLHFLLSPYCFRHFQIQISIFQSPFLAHLSTTCSRGAFRVVMCPSCVVNNFFKHLLLPNRSTNLDQTWQECSLGGPLQKLFTEFDSIKNSG